MMTDDKDYDALAANIAESEGNGDLAHALHQLSQVKAKLAEVEAERDAFASNIPDAAQNLIRNAHTGRLKALRRAVVAEAKLSEVEAERDHWETVAIARQARGIVIAQKLDAAEAALSALEENK